MQVHDPLKILKLIEAAKGQRLAKSKAKDAKERASKMNSIQS